MKKTGVPTGDETIGWLLEKQDPSVRYFTLKNLLDRQDGDVELSIARNEIMKNGPVAEILKRQDENGWWGKPASFYTSKYRGTTWQLMLLAELGADGKNSQVRKAAEFILQNSQEPGSGSFSVRGSEKSVGGLKSYVVPCLTGNMIWSLVMLGYLDDDRVQKGVEWICRYQRTDDGIEKAPGGYPYDKFEICWGRHTCHMGVVKSLKALAAIPYDKRTSVVKKKISELSEYLLLHRIHKKSHDPGKVSRPGWLKPGFPLMYQTDILEILEILVSLGCHDERMDEAVNIIRSKQTSNGRWILENTFNGKTLVDIEKKGAESKWITLKSLYVLSHY